MSHEPRQESTHSPEQPVEAPSGVGAAEGAREALVERIAEAIGGSSCEHRDYPDWPYHPECDARAVLPLVDAEVAAAVSEAQADPGSVPIDLALNLRERAQSAEAEVERLREDLRIEIDLHEEMTARWLALDEGIRALADDLEKFAVEGEVSSGIALGWRGGVKLAAHNVRALLAPSPAATTGERPHPKCHDDLCAGKTPCLSCDEQGNGPWPAPVSSGEAATGEAVLARSVTRDWLDSEIAFVYDRGHEDETPVAGRLTQITHFDSGVSLEVDRQDWDEDGECFTSQEWEIGLDELVRRRPAPAVTPSDEGGA